jgi:hypothetical protein
MYESLFDLTGWNQFHYVFGLFFFGFKWTTLSLFNIGYWIVKDLIFKKFLYQIHKYIYNAFGF